jgi:hypothetical protein
MKKYKNQNNEIFAYEDNVSKEIINQRVKELGLTPISDEEASKLLKPKTDERAEQLAQLEADIKECEDDIKHALIIGNDKVLENLRNEYKSLLAEREKLQEQDEQE